MATLDIEPIELPPGRVEDLPIVATPPETNPAPEQALAPTPAQVVNGADLLQTPPAQAQAPAAAELRPLAPGEYRSMDDYRKLDWSKSNGKLAEEADVSRQRIQQVRRKIEEERSKQTQPGPDNIPQADFSDISAPPGTTQAAATPGASPEVRPDYLVMAKTTFAMSEGILCAVFGPEWKRESEEEAQSVCIPLAVCYEKWGMSDLPPGYVLCFVCLAYAGKRMNKPTTKDKIARMWLWVKSKFQRRKKVNIEQKEQNHQS